MIEVLKKFPRRKVCGAHVSNGVGRCSRKAIFFTKYCWQHESRSYALIGLLVGIGTFLYGQLVPSTELLALRRNEAKVNALGTNFDAGLKDISTNLPAINKLRDEISSLRDRYETHLFNVATNRLYPAEARQAYLADDAKFRALSSEADDLNAWEANLRTKLRTKRAERQIEEQKNAEALRKANEPLIRQSLGKFKYFLWSFTNTLAKAAQFRGDSIVTTNYYGVPDDIFDDGPLVNQRGDFGFKTNSGWHFWVEFTPGGSTATIRIFADPKALVVINPQVLEVILPDVHFPDVAINATNVESKIDEYVGYLIANQGEINSKEKK